MIKRDLIICFLLILLPYRNIAQELNLGLPVGHTDWVEDGKFSPDSRFAATISFGDETIYIWDVSLGKVLLKMHGEENELFNSIEYSPDGKFLLTASSLANKVKLWDAQSGALKWVFSGHLENVNSAVFSNEGNQIITASDDGTACLLNVQNGELKYTIKGHTSKVIAAKFSRDDEYILTFSSDGTAGLWMTSTGKLINRFQHSGPVISAEFSTDGNSIITVTESGELSSLNLDGTLRFLISNDMLLSELVKYPATGEIFATAENDFSIILRNTLNGEPIKILNSHTSAIHSLDFSSDGKLLLSASADSTIKVWDIASGELVHTLSGHAHEVFEAKFNKSGSLILSCSWDESAGIWDVKSGKMLHHLKRSFYILNSALVSKDDHKIFIASEDSVVLVLDMKTGNKLTEFTGYHDEVFLMEQSEDGEFLLTTSGGKAVIRNASTGTILSQLDAHTSFITQAELSMDNTLLLTSAWDSTVKVWKIPEGKMIFNAPRNSKYEFNCVLSPDGKNIAFSNGKIVEVWNIESKEKLMELKGHTNTRIAIQYNKDGSKLLTTANDSLCIVWDAISGEKSAVIQADTIINHAIFTIDGKRVFIFCMGGTTQLWNVETLQMISSAPGHTAEIILTNYSADSRFILSCSADNIIRVYDQQTGELHTTLSGNKGWLTSAVFTNSGDKILTASMDGNLILWDAFNGEVILRYILLQNDNWIALSPKGFFDASPGAMDLMYWKQGMEIIEFHQLKNRYWIPGLWEKLLSGEALPDVENLKNIKLQPQVVLGKVENDMLPIQLLKRDGGYGKVAIFINGKEVTGDARGEGFDTTKSVQELNVDLHGHPYLKPGSNIISVQTSTSDGFLQGRGVSVLYHKKEKENTAPVQFFAVVIGVSNYANPEINLKYTVSDARSVSSALKIGAKDLFGNEHSYIYTITSAGKNKPNKSVIQNTFNEIAGKAKAEDLILVYLSGHGLALDGSYEDFYFLTADATATNKEAFQDEVVRLNQTISTTELTDWLKNIPALKQLMIIDACGSGKVIDNLLSSRNVEASQVKAIDRMKDRTGMFIISGCAADAVSYEASEYGQGLLTYALLQGMKGAALKDDKYVDVISLLNHAKEQVPKLAQGIGGIQKPQLLIPKGGSFDIGILSIEKRDSIQLSEPKSVYVRSSFQDINEMEDVLGLSKMLDNYLNGMSSMEETELIFFDIREYPNACKISGLYEFSGGKIDLRYRIRCGDTIKHGEISAVSAEEVIEKLLLLL